MSIIFEMDLFSFLVYSSSFFFASLLIVTFSLGNAILLVSFIFIY